jgi:hypothetical protein
VQSMPPHSKKRRIENIEPFCEVVVMSHSKDTLPPVDKRIYVDEIKDPDKQEPRDSPQRPFVFSTTPA